METSAILTIGLLGVWCSLCVDDKDKSDQRMLGYALGFGLLFILVCKDLYSEDECSRYEYLDGENDNDDKKTDDKKTDDEKTDDEKTDDEKTDDEKTDDEKTNDEKTDDKSDKFLYDRLVIFILFVTLGVGMIIASSDNPKVKGFRKTIWKSLGLKSRPVHKIDDIFLDEDKISDIESNLGVLTH